jgi:hypothetical protein
MTIASVCVPTASVSGGLLIARWRVLALVVAILWVGAVPLGLTTSALTIT